MLICQSSYFRINVVLKIELSNYGEIVIFIRVQTIQPIVENTMSLPSVHSGAVTSGVVSKNPMPIGRVWLPSEEFRGMQCYQCPCVREGKVELVVADKPDNLVRKHRNGKWCPCDGMQKKWIYLNDPS